MTAEIAVRSYENLIDGRWVGARDGATFERRSPAHDLVVGRYPQGGIADLDAAVTAARRAFDEGPWPHMAGVERARILTRVADGIREVADDLAYVEALESGKPISQAKGEITSSADLWEYAATLCRHTYGDTYNTLGPDMLGLVFREPVGVVGMITPWNFPLLIISQKLPFALAVGCTAIVKPAELTPGTTIRLAQICQAAGLPDGVLNVVTGPGSVVGARLSEHVDVDMLSFTGSTAVGRRVIEASKTNLKKVELELGGKNPQIVFADADLEAALDAVVYGVYFNMGECCNSGSRLLVQRSIADSFIEAVVERARTVPVGDPLDPATKVGAIASDEQFGKIMELMDAGRAEGAQLLLGGERLVTGMGRYHPADGLRRRRAHDADRARGDLRPRPVGPHVRHGRRSGADRQQHPVRALRGRVEPRLRHGDPDEPRDPRRHDLGQHLPGRLPGAAVRRLQGERARARVRALLDRRVHRAQVGPDAPRAAHVSWWHRPAGEGAR